MLFLLCVCSQVYIAHAKRFSINEAENFDTSHPNFLFPLLLLLLLPDRFERDASVGRHDAMRREVRKELRKKSCSAIQFLPIT